MTFVEAAIQILQQNDNTPMSATEIWEKISSLQLVQTAGKTPAATLDTKLRLYQQDSKIDKEVLKRQNSKGIVLFVSVGSPAKFKLIDSLVANDGYHIPTIPILLEEKAEISKPIRKALYQIVHESIDWKRLSIYRSDVGIEYVIDDCAMLTYIMDDPLAKTVKIGRTKNDPIDRNKQLKTGNTRLTFNHAFPSSLYSENMLHDMFDDIREDKDHEFFFYTKKLAKFIDSEKNKHDKVLLAYKKMLELNDLEKDILDSLKENK